MSASVQTQQSIREWARNVIVDTYFQSHGDEDPSSCSGSCGSGGGSCSDQPDHGHGGCDSGCGCDGDHGTESDPWSELANVVRTELRRIEKSHHGDNREELFEKFRIELDDTGMKFAAGYQWFCRQCGKPASSVETWFACKEKFVTTKVICHLGCHNHWRLKIDPQMPEGGRLN